MGPPPRVQVLLCEALLSGVDDAQEVAGHDKQLGGLRWIGQIEIAMAAGILEQAVGASREVHERLAFSLGLARVA